MWLQFDKYQSVLILFEKSRNINVHLGVQFLLARRVYLIDVVVDLFRFSAVADMIHQWQQWRRCDVSRRHGYQQVFCSALSCKRQFIYLRVMCIITLLINGWPNFND